MTEPGWKTAELKFEKGKDGRLIVFADEKENHIPASAIPGLLQWLNTLFPKKAD